MKIVIRDSAVYSTFEEAVNGTCQKYLLNEYSIRGLLRCGPTKDSLFVTCHSEFDHLLHYMFYVMLPDEFMLSTLQNMLDHALFDVNQVSKNGSPLIFFAAQSSTPAVVNFLLNNGARIINGDGELVCSVNYKKNILNYATTDNIRVIMQHLSKSTVTITDRAVLAKAHAFGFPDIIDKYIRAFPDNIETRVNVTLKDTRACIKTTLV